MQLLLIYQHINNIKDDTLLKKKTLIGWTYIYIFELRKNSAIKKQPIIIYLTNILI